MLDYLIAMLIIFALLCAWVAVHSAVQRFAQRHPELEALRSSQSEGPDNGPSGCGVCAMAHMCKSAGKESSS